METNSPEDIAQIADERRRRAPMLTEHDIEELCSLIDDDHLILRRTVGDSQAVASDQR